MRCELDDRGEGTSRLGLDRHKHLRWLNGGPAEALGLLREPLTA